VLLSASAWSARAESQKWIAVGTLDCTVGPSIGLVIGARQHARCFYKSDHATNSRSYVGRLERAGRKAGLPSGGKLIWTVFAPDGPKNELSGRYIAPSDQSQFSEGDSYTVCRPAPNVVCLRPARLNDDGAWKPNLASTISTFRLETGLAHFRSRQKEKP
jgi:hypothetical protein